jgi:hypothetical protein
VHDLEAYLVEMFRKADLDGNGVLDAAEFNTVSQLRVPALFSNPPLALHTSFSSLQSSAFRQMIYGC